MTSRFFSPRGEKKPFFLAKPRRCLRRGGGDISARESGVGSLGSPTSSLSSSPSSSSADTTQWSDPFALNIDTPIQIVNSYLMQVKKMTIKCFVVFQRSIGIRCEPTTKK
ncbi:hypothetical protein B296_00014697 [Ensete ventricosum]|uniref:Uncharacterized protein n=1 Tax=Ensete ventricosum TaxID=4639 RepID=A0A426ZR23_ENSVE|nr:hypothetical protein B296_00014697 [Ensete ventricosum]